MRYNAGHRCYGHVIMIPVDVRPSLTRMLRRIGHGSVQYYQISKVSGCQDAVRPNWVMFQETFNQYPTLKIPNFKLLRLLQTTLAFNFPQCLDRR